MQQASGTVQPRRRIVEFDPMRLVAAAAVVYIHAAATAVTAMGAAGRWHPIFLLRIYSGSAVPAFVFITGALVWARPPQPGLGSYLSFLRRRLVSVVPAYIAWTAAYWLIIYEGYGFKTAGTGGREGLMGFIGQLVNGTAWSHLYFVPLIVLVYVVTPAAGWLVRRSLPATMALALAVGTAWMVFSAGLEGALASNPVGRLFYYAPFAVLGAWYAKLDRGREAKKTYYWLALLPAGLTLQTLYVTRTIGPWPVAADYLVTLTWGFATIVGLAGACSWLAGRAPWSARWSHSLAPATYHVYLAHPAMLIAYYWALRSLGATSLWSDPKFLVLKWAVGFLPTLALAALAGSALRFLKSRRPAPAV